ncbi:MAG: aldo/keto reductase [Marvinbryantia sp.]|jgi:myo-inositol catabolism protein IolS
MEYRKFGKTDLKVSEIGFGAWAIGGKSWGNTRNDDDAVKALGKAWESGINLYDTCDAYGDGHSESLIGEFLKGRRQEAVIVTKGGTNFRLPERSKNFTREYLMMCLDESLQRMQTDYADVYLLHVPNADWQDKEQVFDTLAEMKKSGKVRYTGLAMWGAADTMHALETDTKDTFDVLECPFNILNKSNLDVVKIAKQRKIAVLTSQPLASGILTGKYKAGTVFEDGDNRKGFWTKERWDFLSVDLALIEACARENGLSMAELALAYNLSYEGIDCVIPGGRNAAQVEGNVLAAGKRLSKETMDKLTNTKGFVY